MTTVEDRTYVEEARREKLRALVERGIEPFAYRFDRSHTAAEALAAYDESDEVPVRVAGRVVALRPHGKTTFAHLSDRSGKIQVYLNINRLGPDAYEAIRLLDLSDFIGVEGHLKMTRTGEITVWVERYELLAKALRPLPFGKEDADGKVHSGLTDAETRYRQRYADLAVHGEIRDLFVLRARVIQFLRRFLDDRGYVEVETPVLQPVYGGAAARPFVTHHNALDSQLYLRIADELYLKRCIVGGLEKVYEVGHDFRNEGIDRFHNPEFTMLEFYEAYADYTDMMALLEEMLSSLVQDIEGSQRIARFGKSFDFAPPWPQKTYVGLIKEHTGVDLLSADDQALRDLLEPEGEEEELQGAPRTKLMDEVFKVFVEPHLVQPTFVIDYPIEISPLAKPKRGNPRLTERFELFVDGTEIANAFSELNDPDDQRARFEQQGAARDAGDDEAHTLDADYIRALEYGMPPTGGLGLGVDRLFMLLAEKKSIREVILFPTLRAEESASEEES